MPVEWLQQIGSDGAKALFYAALEIELPTVMEMVVEVNYGKVIHGGTAVSN